MTGRQDDKYLDSGKIIRDLANAEEAHNLDNEGVVEKLKKAEMYCGSMMDTAVRTAKSYQDIADSYRLARGAYLAEIKRRVELKGSSFFAWHRDSGGTEGIGISRARAMKLIDHALAPDPLAALRKARQAESTRDKEKWHVKKVSKIADGLAAAADPLIFVKREWQKLSPVQQEEFFRWARARLHAIGRDPK